MYLYVSIYLFIYLSIWMHLSIYVCKYFLCTVCMCIYMHVICVWEVSMIGLFTRYTNTFYFYFKFRIQSLLKFALISCFILIRSPPPPLPLSLPSPSSPPLSLLSPSLPPDANQTQDLLINLIRNFGTVFCQLPRLAQIGIAITSISED